jgi:adenylylsulfate kinase
MILTIIGLPGAGKTALAKEIVRRTNAIHLNADDARAELSSDLGFAIEDRLEQARRMGAVARLLSNQNHIVVVDFVNPTEETRKSFGLSDYLVWVDRIESGRFEDTNSMWEDPSHFDLKIDAGQTIEEEAIMVLSNCGIYDWTEPTTLMLGRYQPWHEGHQALKNEAHKRTEQVLIGVRNTHGTSEKDPLPYEEVAKYIHENNEPNNQLVMRLPNITNIVYGRDVGYKIEHVDLPPEIQAISATQKRKEMGI